MRNRRKAVSLLTGLLVTAQLFPTAALAADSSESALNKAPGYQDFPAYYSDSAHADDQVTHPDVVVLEEPWNGYRYWAVYTPNVMRISIYENPSIVASSDGVHWVEPEGLSNPIEPQPPSTRYHNCDADMVYNAEYDAMMAYWNWADDQGGGVGAEVRLRISYDGVHWGVPVTYDEMTRVWSKPTSDAERQVADGEDDFITAIASPDRYDMLSPTIVYDDFRDVFILWANNTGDVGYQNGQANFVEMRYSDDGITWGEPVRVNGFLGLDENGQQLAPWHQDVQYVPDLKEFVCISQCFAGRNPDGSVLHLTTSKDGVNWEQVGTKPLLSPGPDGSWDDFQIYRSSFYYEPGSSAGDGTMRVWYSALQKDTNNKMVADSSGNLTIQAKSEDDRIWRIGYAENSFVEMMRVLLDDPGYTTPALVSGNSLMLSAETTSLPTGDVMKLETSFAPVDTSDQVVKYTSSDPDVATVDEFGTITGVSVGSARIMAETREGLSDDLEIAVVENPYTLIPQSNMTATATSVYGGTTEGPASNVLDGNVRTIWHTNYAPKDELPQSITVSFDQPYTVGRFVYTPRQNGTNGIISEYELYAIHQDGSKDLCQQAASDGYTSLMIDGSKLPLDENIALARRVVEMASGMSSRPCVEAELGKLGGKEDDLEVKPGEDLYTDPGEAARFVRETGIDSLAVAIGTAHGFYKGKPRLAFERLTQIREAVDIPLVLHGSSGVPDEDVQRAVSMGVCKVNFATELRAAYTQALRDCLAHDAALYDPKKYGGPAREAVISLVRHRIKICAGKVGLIAPL